ncbi:MAG: porin family protein [Methylobacteriaceae bacterium]|nr:porin family protein [Methylobacteriaceae bacterium]
MIRKILLASVAAATVTGSALAADLPSRKAPPPAFVPPPVWTWTGLYIGVNGGGIWNNSRNFVTNATDFGATGTPVISAAAALAANNIIPVNNRTQFLAGGTWGYNWQWNQWVVGTESDFQGVFGCNNNNNNNGNFGFFGNNNNNNCGGTAIGVAPVAGAPFSVLNQQTITRSLDYLSTSRVRAGFLVTPSLLVYATGGVAIGRVHVNSLLTNTFVGPTPAGFFPGISTANYSQLKAGFVAGGGLEWMFFKDWSVKAEAMYYDLGRSTLNQQVQLIASAGPPGLLLSNTGTQTSWRNTGVIARAGLNYHIHWFDAAPVVARY